MMHPHESTLAVLEVVLELRSQLISLVSHHDESSELSAAWEVASARFPIVLGTLSSPEFLEDHEEALMTLGISGPEANFRVSQFRVCVDNANLIGVVIDGASLLRTLSHVELLGESCRALADFCDGVRSFLIRP
jgi:hypothetical protein